VTGLAPSRPAEVVIGDEPGVVRLPALVKGELLYAAPLSFAELAAAADAVPVAGRRGGVLGFRLGDRFVVQEPPESTPGAERGRRFLVFPRPDPRALVEDDSSELARSLHALPFEGVLDYLAGVREALEAARPAVSEAVALAGQSAFVDPRMLAVVFDLLPQLFDPTSLAEAVDRELHAEGRRGRDFLDGWVEVPAAAVRGMTARLSDLVLGGGRGARTLTPCVRAVPTRQLHITAGNSPLLPVLSFLRGLATKGACVVKSPAEASLATAVVGAAMRAAAPGHPITRHTSLLYWPGGDREFEDVLFAPDAFDRIVVWGSAETVGSVRARTPLTRTVALNPRYGVSLIDVTHASGSLEEAAALASVDTLVWEQQACTASLVHYVQGDEAAALEYSRGLAGVLRRWDEQRRRPLPRVLQGRIRLLRRGEWLNGVWFENSAGGELGSAVVYMRGAVDLSLHPMSRLVVVRRVDRLEDVASTLSAAVASAGVYPEAAVPGLRDALTAAGVSNVFPLGECERTYPGIPHDGMRVLSELVSWASSASSNERSDTNG
jgi:hypothetical protein